VLAANLFSQNQTGALIVIEREIGLRTYIESGVPSMRGSLTICWLRCSGRALPCMTGRDRAEDRIAAPRVSPAFDESGAGRRRWGRGIGWNRHHGGDGCNRRHRVGRNRTISLAVAGNFERALTVEQLRERLSALLRRYVPRRLCRRRLPLGTRRMSTSSVPQLSQS